MSKPHDRSGLEELLVAADGEDTDQVSVVAAAALAGAAPLRVTVLSVADPADHDRRRALLSASIDAVGLEATVTVAPGDVVDTLLHQARSTPGRWLCLTSQGRGPFGDLLAGSITEAVVASSTVPVVIIGPRADASRLAGDGPVLVSISPGDDPTALEAARILAAHLGTGLELVGVVSPEERVEIDEVPATDSPAAGARQQLQGLADALPDAGVGQVGVRVLHGAEVADTLAHLAEETGAAAVVMASHGVSGLRRLLRGSHTLRMAALAPCAVVSVRVHGPEAEWSG